MVVVILPTAGLWAAAGSTLGQVLADGRRQRIVSLVLAGLLAATVVEVWV
jgi:threonine/homoserine/homoserine lactone efflux protein